MRHPFTCYLQPHTTHASRLPVRCRARQSAPEPRANSGFNVLMKLKV